MRLHLASDPQNPGGDLSDGDMNFVPAVFGTSTGLGGGTPIVNTPPQPVALILPDESVQAMAAVSGSGSGGVGSVVAETSSSGFTINLVFDAAAMAAPASFRNGIEQAAAILSETITNKITVNLDIDYSGTGGGAAAGPDNGQFVSYTTVRADLIANAAPGDTSFNALPTGSTIQGQSQVAVWNAQLKLFGLISPNNTTTDDGSATFATDINPNLLVGVALHELTHAIGRVPYGSEPDIFDFYRFTSPGTRLFTDNIPASSAYFSLDGGNTKIADFGVSSDPSDFLNAPNSNLTPNDAFDEFYSNNTLQSLTPIDLEMLDALGFNTTPLGLVVVSNTVEALQGGAAVSLLSSAPNINDPGSTTLSSATIKIANAGGNAVSGDKLFVNGIENGSLGNGVTASWNATTDTLTLSGTASVAVYDTLLSEITFQDTSTDASSGSHPVRTVTWTINDGTNSYNATSTIGIDRGPVATNNTATDAVGTTLSPTAASGVLANASDLDDDSLTVTAVSDTAHGTGTVGSALAGTFGHLTLNANGSYSYVADNTAALNSAATGSHLQDTFSYTVSDGNGGTASASLTITLDRPPVVTASNVALSAGHTSVAASSLFSATDPDGNTITTYAFEDTGSGHFVLNGVVQANDQEIDVSAAQLSQLTYQGVAGSTLDTVEVRVNDGTLWSSWSSFTVTAPLVIQTDGTTALTEVGDSYYLDNTSTGIGPEVKQGGAPVAAGAGGWAVIGAVQVAGGGYDIVWKETGADQYTVWSLDSNGNQTGNIAGGIVTGESATLENFETIFGQDLNGDGTIGIPAATPPSPPTTISVDGTTTLVQSGNNYFLDVTGSSTLGPEVKQGGTAVTAGSWVAIDAVHVAGGGYDIVWKETGADQYTVWSLDSNGNQTGNIAGGIVTGESATLENFETIFGQDLNGDGTIGIPAATPPSPPTTISVDGTTTLVQSGNNYFLDVTGSSTLGPEVKQGGTAVTAGSWVAIDAVHVAGGGYDIVWKETGADQYTVWSLDSNGNQTGNIAGGIVTGESATLENFETIFGRDLNGDGTIGIPAATPPSPPTTISVDGTTTLVQSGNNYFLDVTGSSTLGPEVKQGGTAVTAGSWVAIGAVHVAGGGYDIVWKETGADQYTVWSLDSNGNQTGNIAGGIVTGESATLENFETIFGQDLNGDGTIGASTRSQTAGATSNGPAMANLDFAAGSPAESFRSGNDNFHFNSGPTGQTPASPVGDQNGTTASAGQDGFTFGAANSMSSAHSIDPMPSHSTTFANTHHSADDHSIWTAAHDETFGNSTAPDAVHWLAHQHSGFHIA